MTATDGTKKTLALVYGTLPTVEEIDQFLLLATDYDVTVLTSESIVGYLTQTSHFDHLALMPLPDHSENGSYLPGLEKALHGFDVVVIKERLGMYAFQAVKAKWRSRFRLIVWVDNLTPLPGEDIMHMRTIRTEVVNAADAFLVQSDAARQTLLIEGIDNSRIVSFPAFIENRVARSAKTRAKAAIGLGLADTDFVIAHFGQIEWEEALLDLVHAVKLLESSDKSLAARIKLVLCGIGSFSAEVRDRLVTLGLDRQAIYVAPSRSAFIEVLSCADVMFYSPTPARDRVEGDPYRLVQAMISGVPVLAPRGALVEELIGKHRFDFCQSSADSLARALRKAASSASLRQDIAAKNLAAAKGLRTKAQKLMLEVFSSVVKQAPTVDINALDHQVLEVESLVKGKQYLAAIDVIESIFQLKDMPVHHKANLYRLIGDCFTKLGDGEAGKSAYIQAIELDPYSAKAFIGLGTIGLTRQRYETAVPHFQKAVSLAPEDEMANLGLGLAFQGMNELAEASRWVMKSLEFNPENTAAIFTLVQIAGDRGKYTEVQQALATYVGLHPHDHNMLYTLAVIKFKVGDAAAAKSVVDRIVSIDPYNERAQALAQQINRVLSPADRTLNG